MRSALPVHPICGAIQSIGIVRRDVEGDSGYELGRAILPAVILHGAFDFAVMAIAVIANTRSPPPEEDDGASSDDDNEESLAVSFLAMGVGFAIGLLGVAYYVVQARKQRERLNALESTTVAAVNGDGSALL